MATTLNPHVASGSNRCVPHGHARPRRNTRLGPDPRRHIRGEVNRPPLPEAAGPGTQLRAGLDRILHGRTGALIVLGNNQHVQHVSSGGFRIGVDCTEQALRELAKLDGAIVLSNDLSQIVAAGVHLVPAGDLPTAETGTRHRSADRTSQAAGLPVVTVSASMGTISVFYEGTGTSWRPCSR
ncbi:diadenylate cyclase [Tessaracoccus coleopterorum]|uniref:diadenylate cyclase n=1 Tax=Tessaracoccus coleopterorum TaxID=2714950 RepID=UPI001E3A8B7F|nr:diadenylate cyclase [Tessaracoccus coleopterorum]